MALSNIDELIAASLEDDDNCDVELLDQFINGKSQDNFRINHEGEIIPPPTSFADGQLATDVTTYLTCPSQLPSDRTKTLSVSDVAENVEHLSVYGQKWTEPGLNLMQLWLDSVLPTNNCSSPVVDAFSSAVNSSVPLPNADIGLSAVFTQQPSTVAQCLPGSSHTSSYAVTHYTTPDTVTGTQNSVQYSACQLPGGQLICFPYTPPESASEVNSPPNLNDLDTANQQPSSDVILKADDRQFNGAVVLPSQAPVSLHTSAAAKRTRPTAAQARKDRVKKRFKLADTPSPTSLTVSAASAAGVSARVKPDSDDKVASDHTDDDDETLGSVTAQSVRWSHHEPRSWTTLRDKDYHAIDPLVFTVEADKGFNYLSYDDSFVCQKKNHFQISVRVGLNPGSALPQYVHDVGACTAVPIDELCLLIYGIKRESPSSKIPIEQSTPNRVKQPLNPVKVNLHEKDITKVIVGRLHFGETTSNNMRKRGKPNPNQQYFQLVVSLCACHADSRYLLVSHVSDKIIVRASNPGQFEGDADTSWMRGKSADSIYHMGSVGINTDRTGEALTVHGNVRITGQLTSPSDVRVKTDLQELDSNKQLETISKLKVYSYKFTDNYAEYAGLTADSRCDAGVLAQDVKQVLPDAVTQTHDVVLPTGDVIHDFLVVNKDRICLENIGAVKELRKLTEKLEMRITEMEQVNKRLSTVVRTASTKSTRSHCSTTSTESTRREGKSTTDPLSKHSSKQTTASRDHTSSSSTTDTTSQSVTSSRCHGNRPVMPVVTMALIVVMAMCFISVTTLYLLDREDDADDSSVIILLNNTVAEKNNSVILDHYSPNHLPPIFNITPCIAVSCPVVCCLQHRQLLSSTHTTVTSSVTPSEEMFAANVWSLSMSSTTSRHQKTLLSSVATRQYRLFDVLSTLSSSSSLRPADVKAKPVLDTATSSSLARFMVAMKPDIVKRDVTSADDVLLSGHVLSTVYRQAHSGGNFTYYIPFNSSTPVNASVTLQLGQYSAESATVVLCNEAYQSMCPGVMSPTAIKRDNTTWLLPVSSYVSSSYMFRVALHSSAVSDKSFCEGSDVRLGVDFYEFKFYFERYCFH